MTLKQYILDLDMNFVIRQSLRENIVAVVYRLDLSFGGTKELEPNILVQHE